MAENTGKSEAEAMEELARQMWDRYFRYKASELLEHSLDGYKATVSQNNGDGTLSVTRPYDNTEVTLKCPPSLAASAGEGDQVLVVTLGNLSNAFVLCKTDLTGLGGGGDSLRPEAYDFGTIPASDYFTETLENGHTTRYNVSLDQHGRIDSITDTADGFETTIDWGSLTWEDQADEVGYDNSDSGLTATNVQDALDELANGGGGGGPSPSDATPQDLGTAAAGTSTSYSRGDHVHQMPSAADVGAYVLPSGGIPSADMASAVQTSLGKADTAYQKPSGGIPATDIASGVIPTVPSISTSAPAMDGTASAGSTGEVSDAGHVHPSDTSKANQAQLAYVEAGTTASKNYTTGEYFCQGGELYRATASISSGASFSSANCESVKAMDYYSNTWTPINVTVSTGNAPRNRYIRSGGFLAIYFAAALSSDLADVSTLDICSDVAATFGVTDVLTPFVKAAAISTRTSAATGDIIFNLQFNSNKLTLVNRSGVTVPATNRNVFAWILLGI